MVGEKEALLQRRTKQVRHRQLSSAQLTGGHTNASCSRVLLCPSLCSVIGRVIRLLLLLLLSPLLLLLLLVDRDTAFRTVQALLDHSDKPQSEAVLGRFSKTRHVMDVIDEEEAEERVRQRRRPDEQAELEENDELSEEEDEDRELRRRRAVRRMILNTPAFVPYFRPQIRELYEPPPIYPIAPPSSMFM